MITQENKSERAEVVKKETIEKLQREVQVGLSAERLSVNPDWRNLCEKLQAELDALEKEKQGNFSVIIKMATTIDQKLTAVDAVKNYDQTIGDLKYFLGLPAAEAKRGREASEELAKLRGGD